MINDELLPVGSIVYLKEAERKVVIIGFCVIEEGSNEVWDYLGAPYPIGVISNDKNLLFNREQIREVVFTGHSDDEDKLVRKEIDDNIKRLG
ncbi:MAG: DUF4176 domain-containing protein [Bacilli bacterium]|nr:DUF4176 domain-containing protein [Bacilli bacterium]